MPRAADRSADRATSPRRASARPGRAARDFAALAAEGAPGDWTARGLRARCAALREDLVARAGGRVPPQALAAATMGDATSLAAARVAALESECDAWWPGGAKNPRGSTRHAPYEAWVRCYGRYQNLTGARESGGPSAPHDARGPLAGLASLEADRVEHVLAASLAALPEGVTLSDGTCVRVHPKSYHALRWLDVLDAQLDVVGRVRAAETALAARIGPTLDEVVDDIVDDVVDGSPRAEVLDARAAARTAARRVAALAPLAESLCVRVWAWVLTHPEPGLPFAEALDEDATPPAWTERLAPEDLLALLRAHVRVNHERLVALAALFPAAEATAGDRLPSRLTLAGFLGAVSREQRVRAPELLRRWSLGESFAQAVAGAQAAREAVARAEAERPARDPGRGDAGRGVGGGA